jgi:hypothetical protein
VGGRAFDVLKGKIRHMGKECENMPFIEYLNAVDDLMESRYGITSNDVDAASIAGAQDNGWMPEECVQWLADKYELKRTDTGPYGGIQCATRS